MILRSLIAALAFACAIVPAKAQTGSVKTPTQLNSEINTLYLDQSAGAITPFDIRQVSLDQVASVPFLNIPNTFQQLQTFSLGITVAGSFTAPNLVTNADLANPSTSVNGVTCTLGATCTITATATSTLTFGTHLTGTSYNGSSPVTLGTDATNANTTSTIVARDGSGNFSAGTVTASLTGHASLDLALSALGSNVQTALGNAVNSAGGFVTSPVPYANMPAGTQDTVLGFFGSTTQSAAALTNCSVAVTYSTSTHSWGCNNSAGTGTVTEQKNTASGGLTTSGNCDNTTTNVPSPCNYAMALDSSVLEVNSGLTTSIPGTTATMMGWGSICHITPKYSTRIEIEMTGAFSEVSGGGLSLNARWGTGTAPANGGAVAGNAVGSGVNVNGSGTTGVTAPFKIGGIVTGLTVGTAVWFDASQSFTGSTSMSNPSCRAKEVL